MTSCAEEVNSYAKAGYKNENFDPLKDVFPLGTKLKLEQCIVDCPAPKCRSKKECEA